VRAVLSFQDVEKVVFCRISVRLRIEKILLFFSFTQTKTSEKGAASDLVFG
jgi:hypothetical protein